MLLDWVLIFFIGALVAGALGFFGIAGDLAWVAKVLFVVFLVLFLLSFLRGRM